MADQRLNEKGSLTDSAFNDNALLIPLAVALDGQVFTGTIAQAKDLFGVKKKKYVATGSEGTTLTITELSGGKEILMIIRESGPIFEVATAPDTSEFTFDGTYITLGATAGSGERFVILYKTI